MAFEDQKEAESISPEGKKPYRKPQLQIYGDLGSLTGHVTTGKQEDHFSPGPADMT
jgi:hypothetical protein